MKATWWFMLCLILAVAVASVWFGACGDDDDDDDDNDDAEDDDDEVSWDDRCEDFVTTFYDACTETLFDFTQEEAVDSCQNQTHGLPWECVMDCWDESEGCGSWYDCVMAECEVPSGDDDDGTDDDDAVGPQVDDVKYGTCKDGSKDGDDPWPESLEFSYSDDVLTVTHVNGVFNCCIERIDVILDANGFVLDLYEDEYAPEPCDCMCPYDVETRITDLEAGTYTVNVYVNGGFAITGETTIP